MVSGCRRSTQISISRSRYTHARKAIFQQQLQPLGPLLVAGVISLTRRCRTNSDRYSKMLRKMRSGMRQRSLQSRGTSRPLAKDRGENRRALRQLGWAEASKAREDVSLQRILDSDFRFKEQGFYRVSMESEPSVAPATDR